MADKKTDDQKKPGEQPPGKFHYNPGNMAGKTVNDRTDPDGERTNTDEGVEPPPAQGQQPFSKQK